MQSSYKTKKLTNNRKPGIVHNLENDGSQEKGRTSNKIESETQTEKQKSERF